MSPTPPLDPITPLLGRANHLEVLLVSNLLGFFLTATFAIFAAVYELRQATGSHRLPPPSHIFIGASIFYSFLGGYYYFMLAQYYACIVTVVPLAREKGLEVEGLWNTMRTPSFGLMSEDGANVAMLAAAPLAPLIFSVVTLIALWSLARRGAGPGIGMRPVILCFSLQILVCVLLISMPFLEFLRVTVWSK
ncbi:hypothetical protein [Acrocarpospora macrocephala]|nr:hypothetical protein [Acrocarpospora macrocephala]